MRDVRSWVGLATAAAIAAYVLAWQTLPAPERVQLLQQHLAAALACAALTATMLTRRDRSAGAADARAERFRAVIENLDDVVFHIDAAGCWTYLNPAWERLTGRPVAKTLGRPWLEAVNAPDRAQAVGWIAPVLAGESDAAAREGRLDTPAGPRWVELFVRRLTDADGNPAGATGTLRDVDDARRREERVALAHHHAEQRAEKAVMLASTDELTGLANRRAFLRQLDREIAASVEFGWPLSVAMFDIDHFKRINDTWGHAVGDRVLRQVAERAGQVVRGADLVGRLGGEEFAILMPGATAADAGHVAERLRQAIEAPPTPGSGLPAVTVSVGLAERVERRTADRLLAVADDALYQAKEEGRNRVRVSA